METPVSFIESTRLALGKLRGEPAGDTPDEVFRLHTVDVQPGAR
jgi:hypothetical protein